MTDFWYNLTAFQANNVLEMMQSTNSLFFYNMFGILFLIVLFIIMFRAMIAFNNNPRVSIMFTSFFIAILSIILKLLSLVPDAVPFITWAIFGLSVFAYFLID